MSILETIGAARITEQAKALFQEEHSKKRLDGWFYNKEIQKEYAEAYAGLPRELRTAQLLREFT